MSCTMGPSLKNLDTKKSSNSTLNVSSNTVVNHRNPGKNYSISNIAAELDN
jgi:hypothetical protein